MSKLVYGVEIWVYPKDSSDLLHHWVERIFLTEHAARSYVDAQDKEGVDADTGAKYEHDWEVVFLILEEE